MYARPVHVEPPAELAVPSETGTVDATWDEVSEFRSELEIQALNADTHMCYESDGEC